MATFLILLVISCLHLGVAIPSARHPLHKYPSQSPPKYNSKQHGAIVSEDSICSNIGASILDGGGNAADSLVATSFCLGVTCSHHSGLGGGGFLLIRSSQGEYEYVDCRETAPAAASRDMYVGNIEGSVYGGLASGVPGSLRCLEYVHNKYGSLPWADLIEPSIGLARNGFRVNEDLVRYMESAAAGIEDFFVHDPAWAIDFAPNGTRVSLNQTMTRKRYADTLETIAREGPDAFYTGQIAQDTIATLRSRNGTMTLEDLEQYKVAIRPHLGIEYRGFNIRSCSAPSGGPVVLSIMNILQTYKGIGKASQVNESTHLVDEAFKFSYGMVR